MRNLIHCAASCFRVAPPFQQGCTIAGTVARRAERRTVELASSESVNPEAVRYLNRLSDWFFVAARWENRLGQADVLWIPGAGRGES